MLLSGNQTWLAGKFLQHHLKIMGKYRKNLGNPLQMKVDSWAGKIICQRVDFPLPRLIDGGASKTLNMSSPHMS
jgi:hypothetical protein